MTGLFADSGCLFELLARPHLPVDGSLEASGHGNLGALRLFGFGVPVLIVYPRCCLRVDWSVVDWQVFALEPVSIHLCSSP